MPYLFFGLNNEEEHMWGWTKRVWAFPIMGSIVIESLFFDHLLKSQLVLRSYIRFGFLGPHLH